MSGDKQNYPRDFLMISPEWFVVVRRKTGDLVRDSGPFISRQVAEDVAAAFAKSPDVTEVRIRRYP